MNRFSRLAMFSGATLPLLVLALHAVVLGSSIFDDDWKPPRRIEHPVKPAPAAPAPPAPASQPAPPKVDPTTAPTPAPAAEPAPAVALVVPAAAPRRLPIPAKADLVRSRVLLKQAYAAQLRNRNLLARRQLAQTLLDQAMKPDAAPADRFTLFDGALQAAEEGGSLRLCFNAADSMANVFDVDAVSVETDSALKAVLPSTVPAADEEVVQPGFSMLDTLVAIEDFSDANRLATSLRPIASANPEQRTVLQQKARTIEQLLTAKTRSEQCREKLKTAPNDPAANLEVGTYYSFLVGQWDKGLPFLARGSIPRVRDLATRELSRPAASADLVRLGDGWWDLGTRETGIRRDQILQHAAALYSSVIGFTSGEQHDLLEKRIAAAAAGTP